MKRILYSSLVFTFALVLMPPILSGSSACSQNLTDVDDSSIVCVVNIRSTSRFNISQVGVSSFNQNIRLRTGRNRIIAGDDINDASIISGNISFIQNLTSRLNIINLTIN